MLIFNLRFCSFGSNFFFRESNLVSTVLEDGTFLQKRVNLRAGENIFVLNNQDRGTWIVETMRGFNIKIPAICVLLTGPDTEAIEKAMMLRVELLASWTVAVKELGKTLIGFMLSVFRHWNKEEVSREGLLDVFESVSHVTTVLLTQKTARNFPMTSHCEKRCILSNPVDACMMCIFEN